ncbi:hypothetical protein O5343_26285, partial [Escherichia coli]|nr:hypothetical protein [Escherichia coli]
VPQLVNEGVMIVGDAAAGFCLNLGFTVRGVRMIMQVHDELVFVSALMPANWPLVTLPDLRGSLKNWHHDTGKYGRTITGWDEDRRTDRKRRSRQ